MGNIRVDNNTWNSYVHGGLSADKVTVTDGITAHSLYVNGTTTTVSSTNLDIKDPLIGLNSGFAGANTNDSGLIIERGTSGDNAAVIWDESTNKFVMGTTAADTSSTGNLTVTTGTLVANINGSVTGSLNIPDDGVIQHGSDWEIRTPGSTPNQGFDIYSEVNDENAIAIAGSGSVTLAKDLYSPSLSTLSLSAQGLSANNIFIRNRVGINKPDPQEALHVDGNIKASGDVTFDQGANRTIKIARVTTGENGNNLTIEAGQFESGTEGNGGSLTLKGGSGDSGDGSGGDLILQPGAGETEGVLQIKGPNFQLDSTSAQSAFRTAIGAGTGTYSNGSIINTNTVQAYSNAILHIYGKSGGTAYPVNITGGSETESDHGSGAGVNIAGGTSGSDSGNGGDITIQGGSGETTNGKVILGGINNGKAELLVVNSTLTATGDIATSGSVTANASTITGDTLGKIGIGNSTSPTATLTIGRADSQTSGGDHVGLDITGGQLATIKSTAYAMNQNSGYTWPTTDTNGTVKPRMTAAFSEDGRLCGDEKIIVVKVTGEEAKAMTTTASSYITLIPAPGANNFIVPREVEIFIDRGSWTPQPNANHRWGDNLEFVVETPSNQAGLLFNTFATFQKKFLNHTYNNTYNSSSGNVDVLIVRDAPATQTRTYANKPLLLRPKSAQTYTGLQTAQVEPVDDDYYFRITYKILNKTTDFAVTTT